jgi:hypothetical protein
MDTGDGGRFWELGDHLHVTCPQSRYFRRFAVVTRVEPTRLLVAFDDGNQSEFVYRDSVAHAPPLRVRHRSARYTPVRREDEDVQAVRNNFPPAPVVSAAQPSPGRITAPLPASVRQSVQVTEPLPETQPGLVRIVVQTNTPGGNPMRVIIDSVDTSDDDEGPTEEARTLKRLAFTVATLIFSSSNSTEDSARVLNNFDRTV